MKTFQDEQNEFLENILEERFFYAFRNREEKNSNFNDIDLEMIITSVCNQACSYCYLTKYGDLLYPKEIRKWDNIFENEKALLQYVLDNDFNVGKIELFSGEIWGMEQGNKVLEILLNFIDKGLKVGEIVIPSNCSFVNNDSITEIIENYIKRFRHRGVSLTFSASVDGLIIENKTRPYKNGAQKTEEFYDKLARFCKKNKIGFHPMVDAYTIDYWIDNYKWWMEYLKKYGFDLRRCIMFLEVRNDSWDEENIKKLLEFIDYCFNYEFKEVFHSNVKEMAEYYFTSKFQHHNYENISLSTKPRRLGCTLGRALSVRLGDLAICPCHRLSYDHLLYGKFIKENGKIIGVEANNAVLANKIIRGNVRMNLGCDVCKFNRICMLGCFGSQYETTGDPLIPVQSVCNMMKAKMIFLIKKYDSLGVIDYAKKYLKDDYNKVLFKEIDKIKKEFNK